MATTGQSNNPKINIEMGVDASGVKDGTKVAKDSINELSQALDQQSKRATESFNKTQEAADQTGVGIKKVIQEQKKLAEEAEKVAKRQERATNSIIAAVQRSTAELEAGGKGTAAYQQKIAEQRGADLTKLEPYLAKLREIEKANESVNGSLGKGNKQLNEFGMTAKATAAALRQVPAQFTDIVVSLQGGQAPLTVLLQQGGQLKDIFGSVGAATRALGGYILGLVNPFTLVAAAAGTLAYAYMKGAEENEAFTKSLILTGNAAGTTALELSKMAASLDSGFITQSRAAEVLNTLAQSGNIGKESFERFAKAALEFEKVGGDSVENTIKAFAELGKAPLQASLRLSESTNYLTRSVYEQIRSLEEQGRTIDAAKVAQDAYASSIEASTPKLVNNIGSIERAWNALKGATVGSAASLFDSLANIGRPDAELNSLRLELKNKEATQRSLEGRQGSETIGKEIENLKQRIKLQEDSLGITEQTAAAEARRVRNQAEAAAIRLDVAATGGYSNQQKQLIEITKLANDYKTSIEGLQEGSDEYVKRQKSYYDAVAAVRKKFIETTGDEEVANIKGQIVAAKEFLSLLETQGLKEAELTEGRKLQLQLEKQIAEMRAKGVTGIAINNKIAAAELAKTLDELQQQGRAKKITLEVDLKTDELLASSRELAKSLEDEFQMVGKSRLEQQNITAQRQIQLKYAKELRDLEKNKSFIDPQEFQRQKDKIALAEQTEGYANLKKTIKESAEIDTSKFSTMFGGALDGAFKFADALNNVIEVQLRLNKAMEMNAEVNRNDPAKLASEQAKLMEMSSRASISAYGSMIGGLRSYAKEGTKAYDALYNAEKVFRAFELASAIGNAAKKLGLVDLFVAKKVAGDALMTTSTTANATAEVASNAAIGASNAVVGVTNQSKGDPYTAFPRMAAMAAIMASLGFATGILGGGGGGGMPTNEGKGTTFGDAGKASESLNNSLDILNSTQDVALNYTREMAMSLRNINLQLDGLASIYLRSTGVSDLTSTVQTGTLDTTLTKFDKQVFTLLTGGPISRALIPQIMGPIDKLYSSVIGSLWGKKVSVTGSGLYGASQSIGDIFEDGFQGQYYADVRTKRKALGFTYSTSTSTTYSPFDAEIAQQFGAVFRSIGDTVRVSADLLQIETAVANKRLQEYVVSIGRIDLQNLSGEKIAERLQAVFGAESDKIAKAVIPGFEAIQRVGEGYFETLSRVASQFELVRAYTERLGDTMQLTGVSGGILADSIVNVFGGISEYASAVQQYYEDFFTAEERGANAIIEMTRAMSYMGESVPETTQGFKDLVNAQDLTTESGRKAYATLISLSPAFAEMIKAAEDLKSGYRDAVLTSAEMLAFNEQTVRDQFRTLGVAGGDVPESIAEFRALVDAQNESTDAGKKLKFALMALAPAFVDVITAQEEARQEIIEAEQKAQDKIASERRSLEKQLLTATGNTAEIRRLELESLDASNRALQERIWALEDEKKAQQELAAASSGVVSEIDRLKKSLSGSTEAQSAAALQAQFATTTAQARSGDLTALSKLPTISSALDQAFQLTATTASEVARMKGFLAGSLAETLSILGAGSAEKAISTISSVDLAAQTETDGLELTPTSTTSGLMSGASSTAMLIEEISALRVDNQAQARAIVQLQSRLTKVVERWDIDGIPETRAVV